MTVSDSTVYIDIFTDIRSILVSANLATTNSSTGATSTATIAADYNDKAPNKTQVIINGADKDMSRFKFGKARGREFINVTIDCYDPKTLGVAQLASQVEEAILSASWPGMSIVAVSSNQGFLTVNDTRYHIKSLTFTFDRE